MINYYKSKDVFVLELSGEVTLTTLANLRGLIDGLNIQQYPKVLIDLAKVSFFDSSGIGYLVILIKGIRQAQSKVALSAPKNIVRKLLTSIKVDKFVDIYDTAQDGVEALSAQE